MPSKGGIPMGKGGSSGGRVGRADRLRIRELTNGRFIISGTGASAGRERQFSSRADAEREARNRRIAASRSGVARSNEASNEAVRNRLRNVRGGG